MFERYSFVAITTLDLERARRFWVDALGFVITVEDPGHFFIVDAGGLRLCIDLADGDIHKLGSTDPVIGLKVQSVQRALEELASRGVKPHRPTETASRGRYFEIRDPDGRAVIITEVD
jgi:catechol 2,3-dioxygenase-like lactoylglutathione lyase family enzyme